MSRYGAAYDVLEQISFLVRKTSALHRDGMEGNGTEWKGMEWNGMEWNGRDSQEREVQSKGISPLLADVLRAWVGELEELEERRGAMKRVAEALLTRPTAPPMIRTPQDIVFQVQDVVKCEKSLLG